MSLCRARPIALTACERRRLKQIAYSHTAGAAIRYTAIVDPPSLAEFQHRTGFRGGDN
ncbi:hypothetical protein [Sphaerisporangium perillae]|uniref:hypothetical protein n=1 Tax=Sphaerisporangium perillae TaxID=2935860 RepID=UPI00200E0C60|nr:hypothetical protein [Sphaerisporangium perillae]